MSVFVFMYHDVGHTTNKSRNIIDQRRVVSITKYCKYSTVVSYYTAYTQMSMYVSNTDLLIDGHSTSMRLKYNDVDCSPDLKSYLAQASCIQLLSTSWNHFQPEMCEDYQKPIRILNVLSRMFILICDVCVLQNSLIK